MANRINFDISDRDIYVSRQLVKQREVWQTDVSRRLGEKVDPYVIHRYVSEVIRMAMEGLSEPRSQADLQLLVTQVRGRAMGAFLLSEEEFLHDFDAFIKARKEAAAVTPNERFLSAMEEEIASELENAELLPWEQPPPSLTAPKTTELYGMLNKRIEGWCRRCFTILSEQGVMKDRSEANRFTFAMIGLLVCSIQEEGMAEEPLPELVEHVCVQMDEWLSEANAWELVQKFEESQPQ